MFKYRKKLVLSIIILIGITLLANIYLIHQNNNTLEKNRQLQIETEKVKINTLDIIRTLHLLDIGIRGRALVNNDQIASAMDSARFRKNKIFNYLEDALSGQNFQMHEFYRMRDSTEAYFRLIAKMKSLIDKDRNEEFLKIFSKDPGYGIWLQYKNFSSIVNQFENQNALKANLNYLKALRNSFWLQIILFLLVMPSLAYLSFYFNRSFSISEKLRITEEQHNVTLSEQNVKLEELLKRIERQASDLKKANQELVDYNKRLEDFAFIIAHNIRGPIARIKGLSNIMDTAKSEKEIKEILDKLINTTEELDQVVDELGMILENQ